MIRMLGWRIIAFAWAAQIFFLSTAPFRASVSESFLAGLVASFHLSVSESTLAIVNTLFRKLAHLGQYSIFSLLLYRSFGSWNRWQLRLAIWCVLAAATYAFTDEFHQKLVVGRGPSLIDCGIDTFGAAVAMFLLHLHVRVRGSAHEREIQCGRLPDRHSG